VTYDADEILGRMRVDDDSGWPRRLAAKIGAAPLLPEHMIDRHSWDNGLDLSDGELAALKAAAAGMRSVEAAVLLGTNEHAVRMKWRVAQAKLKAKNTTHACCIAIRQGLIP
jgi:DNA-binding CsgD family transcriptional regulator